jgi:hypothetical protein
MKSLTEFLEEEAKKHEPGLAVRRSLRDEWVGAVDSLIAQMKEWLNQADRSHVLEIEETTHEKREQRIGFYVAKGLAIRLGSREVRVVPVARFVITSGGLSVLPVAGRVDLRDGEVYNSIYRVADVTNGRWVMVSDTSGLRPFDQANFEAALVSMLR